MQQILYKSTRSDEERITSSCAILKGLAPDGGLYVPEVIPRLERSCKELAKLSYKELACEIMSLYLTDYTRAELEDCIERAYDSKFDSKNIAPLKYANGAYYLELFHGKTIAFKDMALSILPHLLTTAARKNSVKDEVVILTATSGDTGKAALAGFAEVEGTQIIVFYPKDGVSDIQERQMLTQKGANTHVIGIKGNFDDAQTGVKEIFNNKELSKRMQEKGLRFSSANSINIGRLVPQIVYYVYAYCSLISEGAIKEGERINFAVPTGNFGNILAAYYAKCMGLPINKLICASNENKVLFDFFETGVYDRRREFILTSSPSMDILISSNLERLIYHLTGDDSKKNSELMEQLKKQGYYRISTVMQRGLADFVGGYATEKECFNEIKELYNKDKYVIDTHTAVASAVYRTYTAHSGDGSKTVVVSTASPYKFSDNVLKAITGKEQLLTSRKLAEKMREISGVLTPAAIEELWTAPLLHNTVCEKQAMQTEVEKILGI